MKNIIFAFFAIFSVFTSASYAANPAVADKPAVAVVKPSIQQNAININTADAQTLTDLKGIGPKKAEAIIAWRKANGNFKTVEQLADVKGIGAATIEANRKNIRVQ